MEQSRKKEKRVILEEKREMNKKSGKGNRVRRKEIGKNGSLEEKREMKKKSGKGNRVRRKEIQMLYFLNIRADAIN